MAAVEVKTRWFTMPPTMRYQPVKLFLRGTNIREVGMYYSDSFTATTATASKKSFAIYDSNQTDIIINIPLDVEFDTKYCIYVKGHTDGTIPTILSNPVLLYCELTRKENG